MLLLLYVDILLWFLCFVDIEIVLQTSFSSNHPPLISRLILSEMFVCICICDRMQLLQMQ